MNFADKIIHENFQLRIIFGKLYFAVTSFLNNSLILADPTLSGIVLTCRFVQEADLARSHLNHASILSNKPRPLLPDY